MSDASKIPDASLQPFVICEPAITGGILLGPAVIGRLRKDSEYNVSEWLFKRQEHPLIRSASCFSLMFYLFFIGVKMDPRMVIQSGKKAWAIGTFSLVLPFALVAATCYAFKNDLVIRIAKGKFLIFAVASLSLTSFPVLAEILTEVNLLNSELGRLAMSSSLIHGIFGFLFMALFTAINQSEGGPITALKSISSLMALVIVIVFAFRPCMQWIVKRTPRGGKVDEKYLFAIFTLVVVVGLLSDLIGATFAFAPLIMGLVVPDGPPLGAALVEKGQLVVTEVLMPLFFAICGFDIEFIEIVKNWKQWGLMLAVMMIAYFAKVVGTMVPAIYCKIPLKNAALLGLMMSFKGVVEVVTFLTFRVGRLVGKEGYTFLLVISILETAISVPVVSTFYKPLANSYIIGRRTIQHLKPNAELRILACVQSENPIPSIVNLLEASCPSEEMPLCAYILHLVELVGRANSTLLAHKNKKGFINPSNMDRLHNVFINYEQSKKGAIAVQPFTTIAPFKTMYQDICSLATEKSVALIIIPFRRKDEVCAIADGDQAVRSNIAQILAQAPCSIGILVHSNLMVPVPHNTDHFEHNVGVLFWGGPDDREALAYGARMSRHTGVTLTIIRFMLATDRRDVKQQQLDDDLLASVRFNDNVEHIMVEEVVVMDVEQTITIIRSVGNSYNLIIVGRKQGQNSLLDENLVEWSDSPELGVVGDMLASNDFDSSISVLVLQQQP